MSVVVWVVLGFVGLVWVGLCVLWIMAGVGMIAIDREMGRTHQALDALERELDACPDVPFPQEAIGHQPLAIGEEQEGSKW